jgi:hypothetical protein
VGSTKIAVIESRWHDSGNAIERNTTVRPFFELLSDLHFGTHHAFEYEMVGTQPALDEALQRLANSRRVTVAYLGMHGGANGLHLHGGGRVSRTHLRNTLREQRKAREYAVYIWVLAYSERKPWPGIFFNETSL